MRQLLHIVTRHTANLTARMVVVALAFFLPAAAPGPNGIASGTRPAPYGFCIPAENFQALRRHHSLAVRIDNAIKVNELWRLAPVGAAGIPALLDFNRRLGIELPVDPEAQLPLGIDIWIPPDEIVASSCCVWLHSWRDGWVTAQSDGVDIGFLEPMYSHAASDSGSIDIRVFQIPIEKEREWTQLAANSSNLSFDAKAVQSAAPELRAVLQKVSQTQWNADHTFSFSQWVGETSKVARMMISLPISDVLGDVRFATTPTVHWLDAHGKDTAPFVPPAGSPLFLVLVSVSGGALLGYLLFEARRRAAAARA